MVDAQIDALQRANLKMTFDPTDLPADAFYPAAKAWALCRAKKAKSGLFGFNRKAHGWPFLRAALLRDLASLNKVELLGWDNWWELGTKAEDQVGAEDRQFFDHAAAVINGLDTSGGFDELLALFDDPRIQTPLRSRLELLGLSKKSLRITRKMTSKRPGKPKGQMRRMGRLASRPPAVPPPRLPGFRTWDGWQSWPGQPRV